MLKGLKRLAGGGLLLMELRGIRRELAETVQVLKQIAQALQDYNAHQWPHRVASAHPDLAPTEITFVQDAEQAERMEIEVGLTRARGLPPTEDEILAEFERRHAID